MTEGSAGRRTPRAGTDRLPLHRLDVPAPHILPFAVGSFDTVGPLSRSAFPHRHTFYEIALVTGGSGAHVLDLRREPLRPPHLSVITPGQVHHWERARELHGVVVLFDEAFLLGHPGDRDLLRRLGERPLLPLPERDCADITEVLAWMRREYREQLPHAVTVLKASLHVLVALADRAATAGDASAAGATEPATAASEGSGRAAVSRRFTRLLARPGAAAERSVRTWAAELGVSTGYLNEAVKETTGRTPGRLIRDAKVLEAKRLLAGTGLTVRRVAREVGFEDAAYFCRFFRREAGTSPGEFRRLAAAKHHGDRGLSIDGAEAAP